MRPISMESLNNLENQPIDVTEVAAQFGAFLAGLDVDEIPINVAVQQFLDQPGSAGLRTLDPRYLEDAIAQLELATYLLLDRSTGLMRLSREQLTTDLLIGT